LARESALQAGFLVAPIPPGQRPIQLGPLVRYVEGETYTSEEIAAFNAGTLAPEALTVIVPKRTAFIASCVWSYQRV
jgi:hypothetical protein